LGPLSATRRALLAPLLAGMVACAPAGPAHSARPAPAAHVVLIVVDGLRPDAIAAAGATQLQALADGGAWTGAARAVGSPETLPSFVTMATGIEKHGVTWNDDRGPALSLPTVFTRVHEAGGRSALYVGKSKLRLLAPAGVPEVVHGPDPGNRHWDAGAGATLVAAFAREFPERRFHLALVHLREPDYVGHDEGWMSPAYLDAVRNSDRAVGEVLRVVRASAVAARTHVLLTADHGGEGTRHWSGSERSWTVPWICSPAAVRGTIAGPVTLLDVAPTVLALLGLPALPQAEGKPVKECR